MIKVLKKGESTITICDLMNHIKENPKIDECGAIFSFEGIARGKEKDKTIKKLDITTPNIKETENRLKKIVEDTKNKYGVVEIALIHYVGEFDAGDSLFLVVVAGAHRDETVGALQEVIEKTKYELEFKKKEHTNRGTNIIMSGG